MLKKYQIRKMIRVARKARENAFAHRSGHKIGACVLSDDGKYYGGCNIESIISGLGSCAERVAMNKAVVDGKYEFRAILTLDAELTYPCGACLQHLSMFDQVDDDGVIVIIADEKGKIEIKSLDELLPHRYKTDKVENLKKYTRK